MNSEINHKTFTYDPENENEPQEMHKKYQEQDGPSLESSSYLNMTGLVVTLQLQLQAPGPGLL